MRFRIFCLFFLAIFLNVQNTFAAQKTWTGGGGNALWENPNNWNPMGAPAEGDSVTIDAATTVQVSSSISLASLSLVRVTLQGSPTLSVGVFYAEGAGLFGAGTLNVNASGTVAHRSGIGGLSLGGWTINNPFSFELDAKNGPVSLLFAAPNSTFNNAGTFGMPEGGSVGFSGASGSQFVNTGSVVKQGGGTASFPLGLIFRNNGSVTVEGGTLVFTATTIVSRGPFTAASGAVVEFRGGTVLLDMGTVFVGAGLARWVGSMTVAIEDGVPVAAENLDLAADSGGSSPSVSVPGGSMLSIAKRFDWSGGIITGTGEVSAGVDSVVTITRNGTSKDIRQTRMTLYGTTTWSGGTIRLGNGALLFNGGTFVIGTDGSMETADSTSLPPTPAGGTFLNEKILRKSAGTGVMAIRVTFNNNASINDPVVIETGTLRFERGGRASGSFMMVDVASLEFSAQTFTVADGTYFGGSGTARVNGATVNLEGGTVRAEKFEVASGSLDGPGNFLLEGNFGTRMFRFSGGELAGSGTLEIGVGHRLDLTGNSKVWKRRIVNRGDAYWDGGSIQANGATFDNFGGFHALFGGSLTQAGAAPTFNNAGTFWVDGPQLTPYVVSFGATINNTGNIYLNGGSLVCPRGVRQTQGMTLVSGALYVDVGNAMFELIDGSLGGNGAVRGTMQNNTSGHLYPGSSPGTFSVGSQTASGSYAQGPGGTLWIEVGGTGEAATDRLQVFGPATLGGTLMLELVNGYKPAKGDAITIATFSSRTGTFNDFSAPVGANGIYLTPKYSATNVVLLALESPKIESPRVNGTTFQFQAPTVSGVEYRALFTDSLPTSFWQTLSNFTGDGGVKTITDSMIWVDGSQSGTNKQRFYQLTYR